MTGILGTVFKTKKNTTSIVSKFMVLSVAYSDRQLEIGIVYDTF